MFRMTRRSFQKLLNLVRDDIAVKNEQNAINSSGSAISPETRLYATLRWLAGGSYLDICLAFGLDQTNFYGRNYILWRTIEALDKRFVLGFSLDPLVLEKVAADFQETSHGQLQGCVSAIDGWICRTRRPSRKEAGMAVKSYRNRKNMWGILVLAGCDAKCRFNIFSCQWSGGTHDCLAWEGSFMKRVLDEGRLPDKYFVIGDEAFVNTPQFLVPWSGRGLGPWKDAFNYFLSFARQCIERAFGLLTKRWGVFWRRLECAMERWGLVCNVAAKLHNFCIDEGEVDVPCQHPGNIAEGDVCEVWDNEDAEPDEFVMSFRSSGRTRFNITRALERNGIFRPPHAFAHSRA
jgi:hypothetical protein